MSIAELIQLFPYIDWLGYINAKMHAGLKFHESDTVIVQQVRF